MAWWPWKKRDKIAYQDVEPLGENERAAALELIEWAWTEFRPRQKPIQRWRDLTRWNGRGAEDARAALKRIHEFERRIERLEDQTSELRPVVNSLRSLADGSGGDHWSDITAEVENRLEELRTEQKRLEAEVRSARELEEEVLGPLREEHRRLHVAMDELGLREEQLRESIERLEADLETARSEVGDPDVGVRVLEGIVRGLR